MKRNLLLTTLAIFICSLGFSQAITHVDYGDSGLVVDINEAYPMDINNDNVIDFYVNSYQDELGFTPIFAVGCFASESYTANTAFGSSVLQLFEEGDELRIDPGNMYDYLDDDRGSGYQSGAGTAEGWVNGEANYIGFAVFHPENFGVTNGWMKVKLDTDNEQLIILEFAFHDFIEEMGASSIIVGDRGLVNVQNLDNVLSDVSVAPNPAQDFLNVNYNYQGTGNVSISIFDNLGKEILRKPGNNQSNISFDTSNWANGIYFVNFNTKNGVHTERIMINH